MTESDSSATTALLRSRAEEQAQKESQSRQKMSQQQILTAVHELRVHQIELEMQNENLRSTQAELEMARERYSALYDNAPVGYVTLNQSGLVVQANLTSVRLLGAERSSLLGQPFSRFVTREDQDAFYLALREAYLHGLVQVRQLRLIPAGGQPFFGLIELLETDGSCHLTLSDITRIKRAEEALREKQQQQLQFENDERLRLALEAGDLGAWDQDFGTGRIVCSSRSRVILGIEPDAEVTWQVFVGRLHEEDRPAFTRAAEASTIPGGGGRLETEFRVCLPGGGIRWLRFAARTFFDAGSRRAVRRAGVLGDITEQKKAQTVLESHARTMEHMVQERTALLQEAVAELEHFSYTLVHDLRAPLRSIRGFSELLLAQSTVLSPTHRQFLERGSQAAERMDRLIVDALNYNKLVLQHFTLGSVDCGLLLRELLGSYPDFQDARACINIVDPLPRVLANPALLTQCFSNLLSNALKFVSPGCQPAVRIWAEDAGERVRLWFEDNGIGIQPESCEKIFHMFQRLDKHYEGTGIGLALVRKAARRMAGNVGVESVPGNGSRFWLELNRAHDAGANP